MGRKLPHAGEVSSNPRPHQKTMLLALSRLVGLSLLLRQSTKKHAPSGAFFVSPDHLVCHGFGDGQVLRPGCVLLRGPVASLAAVTAGDPGSSLTGVSGSIGREIARPGALES